MKMFKQMEAMINSMTPLERRNPDLINGSRKRRIRGPQGSGTDAGAGWPTSTAC
jgi:signal recognition particle subunit SRP54